MGQPTVVVVDAGGAGDGEATATPPAGPAYVTAGELDARLDLLRQDLSTDISRAVSAAFEAQAAAEEAQETAAVAAAVAAEAAADADDENDETDDGDEEQEDETPQPPERRAPAPAVQGNARRANASSPKRYGAGWLSGR